jgi:hypothetical protein
MATTNQSSTKFSPIQLELLKIYSFNPTEEELLELKQLLARFFADRLTEKAKKEAEGRQIKNTDLDRWLVEDDQ